MKGIKWRKEVVPRAEERKSAQSALTTSFPAVEAQCLKAR